jgi:hypothetical protein
VKIGGTLHKLFNGQWSIQVIGRAPCRSWPGEIFMMELQGKADQRVRMEDSGGEWHVVLPDGRPVKLREGCARVSSKGGSGTRRSIPRRLRSARSFPVGADTVLGCRDPKRPPRVRFAGMSAAKRSPAARRHDLATLASPPSRHQRPQFSVRAENARSDARLLRSAACASGRSHRPRSIAG